MKNKTTLFILIFFLFIGNIYSQNQENFDNLNGPVYIGKVTPFSVSGSNTKTLRTSALSQKSAATSLPSTEWPNPGSVHIEKTAEATTTLGKWKINVLVEGKNIPKTTDVVLVIDNSWSMNGTKIASAIAAANTFVNEILTGTTGIQVAVVTINGTSVGVPIINQELTNNITLLNTAISNIIAHDGTNLQGGFYAARQLLNSSTANKKVVVLLSDGDPTYSYSSTITTDWSLACGGINNFNISVSDFETSHLTITSSNYGSVSGDGQNFNTNLYSQTITCNGSERTFKAGNNGLPTIYEAGILMNSGIDIYTIGFEVSAAGNATNTLSKSQNKGYYPATTSNIQSVYSQIRSNISYAATNAVFSDPMSTYIVLDSNTLPTYSVLPNTTGDVVLSKGTAVFSNNGYVLNDPDIPGSGNSPLIKWKITWNIGTVSELGDQMYYFVDMAPNTTPTLLYDANEQTYMDYTDVNGDPNAHQQTPDNFTIPKVSGGKGSIEIIYYAVNEAGQPINSAGTVVPIENAVKLIPESSKYFVYDGSTALDVNQAYQVSPEATYISNNTLYQLYCTFGSVSITPTAADPNKKVWFGYIVSTPPTTANVQYCLNKTAVPLTASLFGGHTSPNYNLYYFDSLNGSAQTSITPSTTSIGQTTYYVAEGKSLTCIGIKVPIEVTINPTISVCSGNAFTKTCIANTAGASIGETAVAGNTYAWTSVPVGFTSVEANPLVNPAVTTTYTVVKTNTATGCTATASVTVTVDDTPINVSAGNAFTKTCVANTAGASIGETAVTGNTYAWTSVPVGFTSVEANPLVNPAVTTTYTVIKTNTATGCTADASVTITVDDIPINVSAGNAFTKTCIANTAGASIGETAVTGNTYAWTSVPVGFTSVEANPLVNPAVTTTYTVVKTNTATGCTATSNVTVTVDESPISVSAGNAFTKTCIANTAGASIGETAVTGNTYAWTSVPAGFTSVEANPLVNPAVTTTYTVVKTNTATGCTATSNVTVTVDDSPINVSAGNAFTKTCIANTAGASIGETAVTGNTYTWTSVPAGFISVEANPLVNSSQTTTYTVVKTNTATGCTATASVTVTVDDIPISVSAGTAFTKTCIANTAGASIGETAVTGNTYAWTSVPVGFTSVEANPLVNPTVTTTYTVIKTNTATGCIATASVTVTVDTSLPISTIAGIVFNAGTNTPLANVPVTLIPQKNTTGPILIRITNEQGYYNFTGMVPGDYLVQVQDANLNSAYELYPVDSSLFFTVIETCQYQIHDFGYDKSDLPVLGDFVWYDINNNGIQDEWFDANNDNLVTQNIPDSNGSIDYSKWEWIDLNGDGSYTGPSNVGELNAAGFGNAKSENLFVTGPNNYSDSVIIGIQGFWRNRPNAGAYGDYKVELKIDDNLTAQSSAMGATGFVKVLPSFSKNIKSSKTSKPASFEVCGPTNENPQTAIVTATDQVHLDLDFGISCKMHASITAVDDLYNITKCLLNNNIIENALSNDLLEGSPAPISAFKFKLKSDPVLNINIDETGNISIADGVAIGEYMFDYEICEAVNPTNCATAKITINVTGKETITIPGITACNGDTTQVDLSKLLPEDVPATGTWIDSDNTKGLVGNTLNAVGILIGKYKFEYKIEDDCPRSIFLIVDINDDCKPLACEAIIIHNAVSANEDNKNDYFQIENLENNDCYKNFKVEIFNRWGILVFERENYKNDGNAFRGRSEGRTTINKNEGLPTGTYFYLVSYDTVDGTGKTQNIKKDGYLYLVK